MLTRVGFGCCQTAVTSAEGAMVCFDMLCASECMYKSLVHACVRACWGKQTDVL